MKLLAGRSLTVSQIIPAEKMSLQLKERDSTASLTPVSLDGISIGNWMQDDTDPGCGIVWRVRSISQAFATRTPAVELEHAIATLRDRILFGEHKPPQITGTTGATTATAEQAVRYILGMQSDWVLDQFDYSSVSNPYKFDGETLFDALEIVSNSLEDAWWSYDFSTYPFKLSITQKSSSVSGELRANRNLKTISRKTDKSGMFTRFYPIGKNDLHIDSEYVEKNANLYGVISKVATDQSIETKAELTRWANEQLAIHAEPVVTVDVEGIELSRATGETLDQFTLGTMCRIPLPEFSTTITERIISISYSDKLSNPEVVKITLANNRTDIARIVADAIKKSGKKSRTSAKKGKNDNAWFEDTNDHVSMVARGIIGVDAHGQPNWVRLSEFIADGEGLHAKVETQMEGVTNRVSSLEITESEIRSDVAASNSQIYSQIRQTDSRIDTVVANKNQVWIQDTDPTTQGKTPRAGDIWVESTHQGTWDGAEGFDWDHDEDYDWSQIQGAKIWGWQNDKWELVSDQQQVVTMTDVEQTSEHIVQRAIKAMTNDDGNLSVYRSELRVEGDRIRSEVHEASSQTYTFILQTASQIRQVVAKNNRIFTGKTQPTGTQDHALTDGDIWVESTFRRTWADMEEFDEWVDDENFDWSDLKGSKVYVYDAEKGEFREVLDEQVLAQDTDIDSTNERIKLVARSVKTVDKKTDVYRAEFQVRADRITSTLTQRIADVGSSITQTASQIRSEVHAAQSTIYSSISQTASQIRAEVGDVSNSLYSSITQTASQIRSEVNAANSTIYSSISQTASQIRAEVANTASGLRSSITQNANRIALVVDADGIKPASIVTAINNGESSVIISATHINLDGYVKATDLTTTWLSAKIAAISSLSGQTFSLDSCYAGTFKFRSSAGAGYTYTDFKDLFVTSINISQSGNTYTLTANNANAQAVSTVTFSRATSLSAGWDGNRKFTVSASPQGNSRYTTLRSNVPNAKASWSNSVGTLTIQATIDDSETFVDVGTVTVNAPSDQGNSASNISLGSAEATTTRPSGTELSSWRNTISNAISGRKYFRFKATLTNGSGSKWYYINFE